LVGPLPKAIGGYRYLLTYICLALRWSDDVSLKEVKAKAVATAMVVIMCRTSLPVRILFDQGSQYDGKLAIELCALLQVEKVRTAPYHPQTNGFVECMHAFLEQVLAKCKFMGLDLVEQQLLDSLAALRQCPCRSTGYSPAEVVLGQNMMGLLNQLLAGWNSSERTTDWNVTEWVRELVERIEAV